MVEENKDKVKNVYPLAGKRISRFVTEKVVPSVKSGAKSTAEYVKKEAEPTAKNIASTGEKAVRHYISTYKPEIAELHGKRLHPFEVVKLQKKRLFGR